MAEPDHGYERGWHRYGFESMEFIERTVHGGAADISVSLAFNRGPGKPHIALGIVYPGAEGPSIGMHIHRDDPTGEDLEEWYVIVSGRGIMNFSNGDSVAFVPGDLLATYPGTGHSIEATGDEPVRLVSITPKMFTLPPGRHVDDCPERFEPRVRVLTTDETKNPLTAECADCGATWERPRDDRGAGTLPVWSVEHPCSKPFAAIHA
jgi:quercetin dioxygenase-like cupin family protein